MRRGRAGHRSAAAAGDEEGEDHYMHSQGL